jgi:undecaprenyl-diphosphatase
MPFLTRWEEDQSRPAFTSALRDLAVRAVLPAFGVFAIVVAFGFMLMGPLYDFSDWENTPSRWFQDARTETGETITLYMSTIGNTEYVIGVCVLVVAILWWRTKQWWYAVIPGIAISLQATIFVTAAQVVGRDRPNVERLDPTPPTSSYPSGHVGAATALYTTFAFMALTRIQNAAVRWVVVVLCVLAPLSVAYARLYRGAHHLSDILFGIINGLLCALLAWNYLRRERAGSAGDDDDARADTAQTRA